jgi:hypothetical protein
MIKTHICPLTGAAFTVPLLLPHTDSCMLLEAGFGTAAKLR